MVHCSFSYQLLLNCPAQSSRRPFSISNVILQEKRTWNWTESWWCYPNERDPKENRTQQQQRHCGPFVCCQGPKRNHKISPLSSSVSAFLQQELNQIDFNLVSILLIQPNYNNLTFDISSIVDGGCCVKPTSSAALTYLDISQQLNRNQAQCYQKRQWIIDLTGQAIPYESTFYPPSTYSSLAVRETIRRTITKN